MTTQISCFASRTIGKSGKPKPWDAPVDLSTSMQMSLLLDLPRRLHITVVLKPAIQTRGAMPGKSVKFERAMPI
jgi:hypothetical protein